uniref:Uncharacterized protein n=1 Tax=Romanomermis culicivorax TaxID=13658 RepID=A0A915K0Q3_ROMCU
MIKQGSINKADAKKGHYSSVKHKIVPFMDIKLTIIIRPEREQIFVESKGIIKVFLRISHICDFSYGQIDDADYEYASSIECNQTKNFKRPWSCAHGKNGGATFFNERRLATAKGRVRTQCVDD